MAVPAPTAISQSHPERKRELTPIQMAVVTLMASGKTRREIVDTLMVAHYGHLRARGRRQTARKSIYRRLYAWEQQVWFRNALYEVSLAYLDLDTAAIFRGISRKAQMGRVDAARLALEVTGRHNNRADQQVAAVVNISFGDQIPRPNGRGADLELEVADEELVEPSDGPDGR